MNLQHECLDYCLECHEEVSFCQCNSELEEYFMFESNAELQSELPEHRPDPLLNLMHVKSKRPKM